MKFFNKVLPHRAIVLLYHSIADVQNDPFYLHVNIDHFESHLKIINHYYAPISMTDLIDCLTFGYNLPKRAVVLTFDDGYANSYTTVTPLLEKYHMPATLFVTSGQVNSNREFWWDELEQLLLLGESFNTSVLFDLLDIMKEKAATISLGKSPVEVYLSIWERIFLMSAIKKEQFFEELCKRTGKKLITRSSHRILTKEEFLCIGHNPNWEIGAHSVSHYPLAELSKDSQRVEIVGCKDYIESVLKRQIQYFSYAHGSFSDETESLLDEMGFRAAFTTKYGIVSNKSDIFHLPRLQVKNWPACSFGRILLKGYYS